jgi:hypothetical protein
MNKLKDLNLKATTCICALLLGCLLTTDACARGLYKSVGQDGKITYSSFPPAHRQSSQNISSLKNSPKFSLSNKQFFIGAKKS